MGKALEEFKKMVEGIVDSSFIISGFKNVNASIYEETYKRLMETEEMQTIYNALKEHEELEQEINLDLTTFRKLMKQSKITFIDSKQPQDFEVFYDTLRHKYVIRNMDTTNLFPLSDYKKNWWLKEDKGE